MARKVAWTLFEAAFDGAAGHAWARDSETGPVDRWWSTQGRHLDRGLALLGAAPDEPEPVREQIAATLGVDTLLLRESARQVSGEAGYQTKAQVIVEILRVARRDSRRALRLCGAAYLARLWGRPRAWLEDRKRLREFAFP